MKRPVARIRLEIGRLQEQLRQAESREAERVGRLALRAGLCEIEMDDALLVSEFEKLTNRFRGTSSPQHSQIPRGEQVLTGKGEGSDGPA